MRVAVIGGGAAGFFFAISLKEMMPEMELTIFERGQRVLSKVEVSGGGRCNCTNSFRAVSDLSQAYPRGHRLMKRLFHVFDYRDAYQWFERHGVPLVVQTDECVFPRQQDAHAIIDCFLSHVRRYGVRIFTNHRISSLEEVSEFDFVVVTTGGSPRKEGLQWLQQVGHKIAAPVPSLFSFTIDNTRLQTLQGLVLEHSKVFLPGTKFHAEGPLLITHWGLSGPAVLKLSSYAARHLADVDYRCVLCIKWLSEQEDKVRARLQESSVHQSQKMLMTFNPFGLPQRLWEFLVGEALTGDTLRLPAIRWCEVSRKDINRIVNVLTNYTCQIVSRAPFKDEFVTCGGIALTSVCPTTLESRCVPRLFFAGEVLDIDGITGGFNFQAAWTTAYTVANAIASYH